MRNCFRIVPLGWVWLAACQPVQTSPVASLEREVCNGVDDDGDGLVDAEDADLNLWAYRDEDGDGVGAVRVLSCGDDGTVAVGGDCDDAAAEVFPGAVERCNGIDDDCDGAVDDDDVEVAAGAYVDADGDGFGGALLANRCPAEGEAAVGGDCDDALATVFPGAPEACDGVQDNNCDGLVDANDADGDGDGEGACTDCDDTDPGRSTAFVERCSGIDDDCDGLVDLDDPTVNPYTCGAYCPSDTLADVAAKAVLSVRKFNPCYLDPRTEGLCADDGMDLPDAGQRVHRVQERVDTPHARDSLFLFLPPGPGNQNAKVLSWAGYAGYRTITLGYVNHVDIEKTCTGKADGCFTDFREETLYGADLSPYVDVSRADSVEVRLEVLLSTLVAEDAATWGRYLDSDGDIVWSEIVVAGWSVGAGFAAMLAKHHDVKGVLLLSGPKDRLFDPEPIPSSWIRGPQLTDGCRFAGVYHVDEMFDAPPNDVLELSWSSFGLSYPEFFYEGDNSGFDHQIMGLTTYPPGKQQQCRAHATPARDDCLVDDLFEPYRTMMCQVEGDGYECP